MRTKQLVALLVLLAFISLPSPVHAEGVVTVCDEVNLVAALTGGGTVTFACSGTITLTNTITIAADTTIDGSGQSVTISGNNAVGLFIVNSGIALNVNSLTLANGFSANPGGAIRNVGGMVTVTNSALDGNSTSSDRAGAVYNENGVIVVSNSTFSDNSATYGGGIFNLQSLQPGATSIVTVSNSIFSNNSTSYGGGIYNIRGTLTVSDSAFDGNWANNGLGGGIFNDVTGTVMVSSSTFSGNYAFIGAGVGSLAGTVTISNSTFTDNSVSAAASAISNHGTMTVINSTIANNNQYRTVSSPSGTLTLRNTIVANNGTQTCYGNIIDGGGNLSYPSTVCPGINVDPLLGPLQNNSGPTQTMAPGLGSGAIDAGDDAICAANPVDNRDQRGHPRDDWRCDIGAVEVKLTDTDTVFKEVTGAGTFTFGPTLAEIEVADTGGCLTGLTVRRVDSNHPNANDVTLQTGHYWAITPEGCTSGFSAGLTLPTDFTPDANDTVCRYTESTWDCAASSFDANAKTITRQGVTEFSDWVAQDNAPLAVLLASFAATVQGDHIRITWETASEINSAGFNLWRGASSAAPSELLAHVPSQAPGSTQGASYSFTDDQVAAGETWYYWLEDVDLSGATTPHGPVSATLQTPTVVKLDALDVQAANPTSASQAVALVAALIVAAGVLGVRWRSRIQ